MLMRRRPLLFRGGLDLLFPRPPLAFAPAGEFRYCLVTALEGRRILAEVLAGRLVLTEAMDARRILTNALEARVPGADTLNARRVLVEALEGRVTEECS